MITYIIYFRHNSESNLGLGLALEMDCVQIGEDADIYEVIIADDKRGSLERQLDAAENVLYYEVPADIQASLRLLRLEDEDAQSD